MKLSEQLFYSKHPTDWFFDFPMKMPSLFGKGIALYCLIESRRYLIKMTISH